MHDVLFVVSYIKLKCFTCVYLINYLYVSIFTGSPRRPTPTHAPTGKLSDNHYGSCSVHVREEDNIVGVDGEVPHKTSTLNAYIFFFQYHYL